MAKTKTKKVPAVDVLTLNYQLSELPSSQHRAGLAGLVLIIQWLERQPEFKEAIQGEAICKLSRLDSRGATLELNQIGLKILFDEIYAAGTEEQARPQPLKNKQKQIIPPLREEEREVTDKKGKTKKKKVYIYPVVVPKGSFLVDPSYDSSSDGKHGDWIKLWRDMVWSILRGVPATRKPFEARAEDKAVDDAAKSWKQLVQPEDFTVDLPSTYFLGAQANNAENIPFKDRAKLQFLLHFWLFAAQIYVPAISKFEKNKETKKLNEKREFVGYAIAIPDIADLEWFCEEFPIILSNRSPEKSGYRPRDCIVDLAVEGALDMMKQLKERLTQSTGEQATASTVLGIDVIHTAKQGNNIRLLGMARLNPEDAMIDEYSQIRQTYWSPLFRRQYLLNLVNHSPWYSGFDALLCNLPYEQSIENEYFRRDVSKKIDVLTEQAYQMVEATETKSSLEPMIFRLIKTYVSRKLKVKYGLEWEDKWLLSKDATKEQKENRAKDKNYQEYSEKRGKIAKSAFLDVRSRTEPTDFINYFVSTLCSVPQYMQSDDFTVLTQALYQETDKVRTLTLLALSANG